MSKIECLENVGNDGKLSRKEFWQAFGEVAPPKDPAVKAAKKRRKFWKRFVKKVPDACAKVSVRILIVVVVLSVLALCGINPVRLIVSKTHF